MSAPRCGEGCQNLGSAPNPSFDTLHAFEAGVGRQFVFGLRIVQAQRREDAQAGCADLFVGRA
jgi:hypothetical protein